MIVKPASSLTSVDPLCCFRELSPSTHLQKPYSEEERINSVDIIDVPSNGATAGLNGNGNKVTFTGEVTEYRTDVGSESVLSNGVVQNGSNGYSKGPAAAVVIQDAGSNGNGNGSYANGKTVTKEVTVAVNPDFSDLEGFMDPCQAGQLDTCAVERLSPFPSSRFPASRPFSKVPGEISETLSGQHSATAPG